MASLPTETASADYSTANFVSVFAVISTFRTVICSAIQEPEELEAAVQCTSDNTQKLRELALLLLGAASGKRSKGGAAAAEQWSRLCSQLAASTVYMLKTLQVPEAAADSLDAFVEQSPAVRVDVLHWLCEIALMDNPAIKALADRETTKARKPSLARTADLSLVRLQPFAEISKQRYWLFGNKTRRLYMESLSQRGRGRLELLAQTPDEFSRVAEDLRAQRTNAPKELADRLTNEVVPFLEAQAKKQQRVERSLQRQALAMANVHIYETRTRKRQRVNYNIDDGLEAIDG